MRPDRAGWPGSWIAEPARETEVDLDAAFRRRFAALAEVGRDPATGGYHRAAWTEAHARADAWFDEQARQLGLIVDVDPNGNRWAWWLPEETARIEEVGHGRAVVTGSHLDTVPEGGAYDGALGVVAGFAAVEWLRAAGPAPAVPIAVVAFADEEGARYNTPCLGSGLFAGQVAPADVLERRDADGVRLRDAVAAAGLDPAGMGHDPVRLQRVGAVVELHIEQGRSLVFDDAPIAVGTAIWPHGRWRIAVDGETNHAGTTRMADRRDPMRGLAALLEAAPREALARGGVATVGRVDVRPNGTNAVPGGVRAWLDVRAPDPATVDDIVAAVGAAVDTAAHAGGVSCEVTRESFAEGVAFNDVLRHRMAATLRGHGWDPPALSTAAGHDAGVLASVVPAGMLYVRNREGVSHSPAEHADEADCVAGVRALAAVLADLAGGTDLK